MSYINNSYDINVIDNWYSDFDDYRGTVRISKNGQKIGDIIVNFDYNEIQKTIGREDYFRDEEIKNAIVALVATNINKYCSLPKISEISPLLTKVYDSVRGSGNSMCYISDEDWELDFSDTFSETDIENLENEIERLQLDDLILFEYDDCKIVGFGNLETAFIDDRGVISEKQITAMDFLKEEKEMILYNKHCYSDGRFISVAKKGYEKEFNRENQKLQIVEKLIEQEQERPQKQDLDYYAFVIGYDFLHDYFINSAGPECDVVFEECYKLAREYMKSDEYTNMFQTGYENLQDWLDKNEYRIKNDYMNDKPSDKPQEKARKSKDRER